MASNQETVILTAGEVAGIKERLKQRGGIIDTEKALLAISHEDLRAVLVELAAAVREEREAEGPYYTAVNEGRGEVHRLYLAWDAARKRVTAAYNAAVLAAGAGTMQPGDDDPDGGDAPSRAR